MSFQDFDETYQPKKDFVKALAILAAAITGTIAINHTWVASNQVDPLSFLVIICHFSFTCIWSEEMLVTSTVHLFTEYYMFVCYQVWCNCCFWSLWTILLQNIAMALFFAIGYAGIVFEESLAFNKSGVGLLMAVSLWVIRSIGVRICMSVVKYFVLNSQCMLLFSSLFYYS